MRVSLGHDYLTQRGGAERVALHLSETYSSSPLYTSVFNPRTTFPGFQRREIRTSWLQRYGFFRRDPRRAVALLPSVWSGTEIGNCDVALLSSSGWAHGATIRPGVRKVVYCHNPPRWLHQESEYTLGTFGRAVRGALRERMTEFDVEAAHSADLYIANSTSVADRVLNAYGITAQVVFPPVMIDEEGPEDPVPDLAPGFWLTIGRARGYKNTSRVVEAFRRIPAERLVTVGSHPADWKEHRSTNILHQGFVSEARLRWFYRNARGLITLSYEDFGLTPLEANLFGSPVIALRRGGHLDTVISGVNGTWVDSLSSDELIDAIAKFPEFNRDAVTKHARGFSRSSFDAKINSILRDVCKADRTP